MQIILTIIATGIPGFLSYWILSQFRLVELSESNKDEKVILLSTLSFLNIFLSYLILNLLGTSISDYSNGNLAKIFFVSLGVVLFMSVIIYPLSIHLIKFITNLLKTKFNMPFDSNRTVLDSIMKKRPKNKKHTQAYIFDFENNLIIAGSIGHISHKKPELAIENKIVENVSYEEVVKLYGETKNIDRDIFIDYDKCIKIFLLHF